MWEEHITNPSQRRALASPDENAAATEDVVDDATRCYVDIVFLSEL